MRCVILSGPINSKATQNLIRDVNELLKKSKTKPINFYINSAGGHVTDALAIHDFLRNIPVIVNTVGLGVVASMAVLLLISATGRRSIYKNTLVQIHLPFGRTEYKANQIEEYAEEINIYNQILIDLMDKYSKGKVLLSKLNKKDNILLNSKEALDFNIIDEIIN